MITTPQALLQELQSRGMVADAARTGDSSSTAPQACAVHDRPGTSVCCLA